MGEGGIIPLDASFLRAARAVRRSAGATLIFDEIQCGLGRTGTLFAFEAPAVRPDIVTLAKPLGGGLPLGRASSRAKRSRASSGRASTARPSAAIRSACRLGLAVLDEIEEAGLLDRIADLGAWFARPAGKLAGGNPRDRGRARGRGLMWGIELDREAAPVARRLLERASSSARRATKVLRLLPPYIVPKAALCRVPRSPRRTS